MFIEDKLKRIYLNYKIKEIIPFHIKLAQEKTESAVILKKNCGRGYIYMFTAKADNNLQTERLAMDSGYCYPKISFTNPLTLYCHIWLKQGPPFRLMHNLFLSTKTMSGTAFEAIIHKIISDNFDTKALRIIIRQRINFGILPVKRLKNRLGSSIGLNTSHNRILKKLVLSILSTIDQPVFNLKKAARDL